MRFKRSEGLTPSERILADLCDRSFLKLWTYPNLFKKPAKELTDLLVVFGNNVIIFSDKSCVYPDTGNAPLDWSHWYRRSIARSAHQIDQAERWLRTYPSEVFLDAKCSSRLPIALPARLTCAFTVFAWPWAPRSAPELLKERQHSPSTRRCFNDAVLFTVGRTDSARGLVHVFDEASLAVVLGELSTVSDFVHYLSAKEALLVGGRFMFAEAETDIMAYYLWNGREFPASQEPFRLEPNLWVQVEAAPEFLAGREENRVSIFWDNLIEYITNHYLNETLEFGNELEMSEYEQLVRVMAGETRFFRRVLSKSILERAAPEQAISSLLTSGQDDVNYVLYIGRGDQGGDHAAYRADRASQLQTRCIVAKAVKPERRYIVGMAMDARGVRGSSEDFVFMDTKDWPAEAIAEAEKARQELGYFLPDRVIEMRIVEDEYPGTRRAE